MPACNHMRMRNAVTGRLGRKNHWDKTNEQDEKKDEGKPCHKAQQRNTLHRIMINPNSSIRIR